MAALERAGRVRLHSTRGDCGSRWSIPAMGAWHRVHQPDRRLALKLQRHFARVDEMGISPRWNSTEDTSPSEDGG